MQGYKLIFGAMLAIVFVAVGMRFLRSTDGNTPLREISAEALKTDLDDGKNVTVINVLSQESYDDCRIDGSINIPLSSFDQEAVNNYKDKEKVVVYCASSACTASHAAYDKLVGFGFSNAYAYEGGMKEWKQKGYPTQGLCQAGYLQD